MRIPPSSHFTPILLTNVFNIDREHLTGSLQSLAKAEIAFGSHALHGIPFELGLPKQPNVILLDQNEAQIDVEPFQATYVIFLHVVEDCQTNYLTGLADFAVDGNGIRASRL